MLRGRLLNHLHSTLRRAGRIFGEASKSEEHKLEIQRHQGTGQWITSRSGITLLRGTLGQGGGHTPRTLHPAPLGTPPMRAPSPTDGDERQRAGPGTRNVWASDDTHTGEAVPPASMRCGVGGGGGSGDCQRSGMPWGPTSGPSPSLCWVGGGHPGSRGPGNQRGVAPSHPPTPAATLL